MINVTVRNVSATLQLGTNESYKLTISADCSAVTLSAETIFGAYHGLETLSQLIRFDFDAGQYVVSNVPWVIEDSPRFVHREVLADSARRYLPLATLYRVLDSMAMAKLNVQVRRSRARLSLS